MPRVYSNKSVVTTVANVGGLSVSSTSLVIADNTGYPTSYPFTIRINPGSTDEEIVDVNSGLGTNANPYQLTRGQDSSSAKTWASGTTVVHGFSARDFTELQSQVAAAQAVLATGGSSWFVGLIVMWSGSIATIPAKFALCNGQNGTPDLTSKFVVGAGSTYAVAAVGGSTTTTLNANHMPQQTHTHTLNVSGSTSSSSHTHDIDGGAHQHNINSRGAGAVASAGAYDVPTTTTTGTDTRYTQSSGAHSHNVGATAHTHTVTVSGTLANAITGNATPTAVPVMPPYYALAYIMRTQA